MGNGSEPIYTASVTAFHIGGYLTVMDYRGRSHSVPLENVFEDVGRVEVEGPDLLN